MQRCESAMSWKAHDGEVYSVEFSYDENTVYSVGEDRKVGPTLSHTHTLSLSHTHSHPFNKTHSHKCVYIQATVCVCVHVRVCVRVVCPVEHPPLWREAVGAAAFPGCNRSLCSVGL